MSIVHGNPKVVVNCSGIGARKLVGDKLVSPLRGQVSTLRTIFENLRSPEFSAVHNVYFVKYDVTVSFMAQVLDTVTYFVSHVLVVDTVTYFDIFR